MRKIAIVSVLSSLLNMTPVCAQKANDAGSLRPQIEQQRELPQAIPAPHARLPPLAQASQGVSIAVNAAVKVTQMDGSPLPAWLTFDPALMRFQASAVPDKALPLQVRATVGTQQVTVVISERPE